MDSESQGAVRRSALADHVSLAAGVATTAVGVLALGGWIWDIHPLKSIYGPITMKVNAAIGLILCGVSVLALRWSRPLSRASAAAAGAIGALTLFQHLTGFDLGIDQLLFTEAPGAPGTASPNRMGPNGAVSFILASISLWCLASGRTRHISMAQRLSAGALILPSIPVAGYLYGAEELYGVAKFTGIALHTALAFMVLHIGILTARTDVAPASVFVSQGPAGTMLRWLTLPVVAIPMVLGYLEIAARRAELVDRGMGLALYAMALIVLFGFTVWQTARMIDRSDAARRVAEHDRDALIESERQARADAERSNRLKDQFLATLSHELRTPLNVMLGWTQILESGVNPAEHTRIAGVVARNGRLLARLVGDLLDISRASTAQFDIFRTPVVLDAVVQSSLDAIRPTAAEKGVAIDAELASETEPLQADAERLQQIVWNLLSNAVKFTPPGGRIVVRTAVAREGIRLTVSDTGIGFDAGFAPDLFKPFRQADSSASREHGGLGLGLSIAKHLAELHGGSLEASSPGLGHGATFTLTLPRLPSEESATPVAVRSEPTAASVGEGRPS